MSYSDMKCIAVKDLTPKQFDRIITKPILTEPVLTEPILTKPVVTKPVLTEPVLSPQRPESIHIVLPVSVEVHRSV